MEGKKICSFRDRITELVSSSGKSQSALASDFGIAKQTLSAWITGQNSPRAPVISALAEYFNVSVPWLMGFDVPREVSASNVGWNEYLSNKIPFDPDFDHLYQIYHSLTPKGKEYLFQQAEIAAAMF